MDPRTAYEILTSEVNLEGDVKQALLDIVKEDPKYASKYAEWAFDYARLVIKGRFPEAEPYIQKDPWNAYRYAEKVIKGRWEEAEEIIKTDPASAYNYARNVIEGRWKEAEEYIKTDSYWAYFYAENIIKGRWQEAEEYIKKDPEYACKYAEWVIGDTNFWKNQKLLADFMKSKSEPKPNSELDDLKKQREELDKRIKQLECV